MTKKLLAGNWKMNANLNMVSDYLYTLSQHQLELEACAATLCIIPPFPYLHCMQGLRDTQVFLGAQNLAAFENGAYTGEVSAPMLKEMGCGYALVGHSERRQFFNEQGETLKRKYQLCQEYAIIPILCIGETRQQRELKQTFDVLRAQLKEVLLDSSAESVFIAYEPVWAIGTGVSASKADIEEVHRFIKQSVPELTRTEVFVNVLYGGSVTEHNAALLLNASDVDGGLVGGASLDAARFLEIAKCIN